jgi:hypothetical protein
LVRPPRAHKLPLILSREEVQRILKLEDDTNRPSTGQSNIPRPGFALPQVRQDHALDQHAQANWPPATLIASIGLSGYALIPARSSVLSANGFVMPDFEKN